MKTSATLSAVFAAVSLLAAGNWAHATPAAQAASAAAAPVQTVQPVAPLPAAPVAPVAAPAAPAAPAAYPQATISLEQAIAIAEKNISGGKVKDVELDYEWGRMVYEMEVMAPGWREYDVVIDATTGKVLSSRLDWFD